MNRLAKAAKMLQGMIDMRRCELCYNTKMVWGQPPFATAFLCGKALFRQVIAIAGWETNWGTQAIPYGAQSAFLFSIQFICLSELNALT